jgi:hypothetical protein
MHTEASDQVTTANCLRCGRTLRAAQSVSRGYGRTCRSLVRKAAEALALVDFKAEQVTKAREVIEQGGVVPTSRRNVFQLASSKGDAVYLTAVQACNCPAGLKGRRCYHRAAVAILTAA